MRTLSFLVPMIALILFTHVSSVLADDVKPVPAEQAVDPVLCPCEDCQCVDCQCGKEKAKESLTVDGELHAKKLVVEEILVAPKSGKYQCRIEASDGGVTIFMLGPKGQAGSTFIVNKDGSRVSLGGPSFYYGASRPMELSFGVKNNFEPTLQINDGMITRVYCLGAFADKLDDIGLETVSVAGGKSLRD